MTLRNLPTLCLPNIPEAGNTEELQSCLMWLCNSTDVVGRAKALVKRRLEEDQTGEERKRELRRQLERKNRELETESDGQTEE